MEFQSPSNPPASPAPAPTKLPPSPTRRPAFTFYPRTVPNGAPFLKKANVCVWLWPFVARRRSYPRILYTIPRRGQSEYRTAESFACSVQCVRILYIIYTTTTTTTTTTTSVAAAVEVRCRHREVRGVDGGGRWAKSKTHQFSPAKPFRIIYNDPQETKHRFWPGRKKIINAGTH